jgi:hypothetical protein
MVRSPMQVDPKFHERMKKLQEDIMRKQGKFKGFPKIQREMISMPEWDMIEKKLIGESQQFEIKINFDRRKRQ